MKEKLFISIVLSHLLLVGASLKACELDGSLTGVRLGMEVEKMLDNSERICDWTLDDIVKSDLILECKKLADDNRLHFTSNIRIVKNNISQDVGPHCITMVTGVEKKDSFGRPKDALVVCDNQSENSYYNFCFNKDAFIKAKEKLIEKIKKERKDNINFHPDQKSDPNNNSMTIGVRG